MDRRTPVMDRSQPDETSLKVELSEYNKDKLEYKLKADKIERFYERKILNGYRVLITTFDDANQVKSTIKADTTIVDDVRNMIYAHGNVFFSSPNGSIQAKRLIWDRTIDEIISPEPVILTRDGNVLRGSNLRTNSSISYAELETVSAEGKVDEKDINW